MVSHGSVAELWYKMSVEVFGCGFGSGHMGGHVPKSVEFVYGRAWPAAGSTAAGWRETAVLGGRRVGAVVHPRRRCCRHLPSQRSPNLRSRPRPWFRPWLVSDFPSLFQRPSVSPLDVHALSLSFLRVVARSGVLDRRSSLDGAAHRYALSRAEGERVRERPRGAGPWGLILGRRHDEII